VFDSMNMHMPVVIALVALFLLVLVAGLFVVVRVVGQRVVDDEASGPVGPRTTPSQPESPAPRDSRIK